MTRKLMATAGLTLALLGSLDRRAAADGGVLPPTSREESFPFTETEGQRCESDLWNFRAVEKYGEPSINVHRARFRDCVLRLRQEKVEADRRAQFHAGRLEEGTRKAEQAEAAAAKRHKEAIEAAEQDAKLQDAAQKMADNPTSAQVILSAFLCDSILARSQKSEEIAKDRKYSRVGGAVDLRRRVDLQDELRTQDERIEALRRSLAGIKKRAMGCKDKAVVSTSACMFQGEEDETDACKAISEVLSRAAKILEPRSSTADD